MKSPLTKRYQSFSLWIAGAMAMAAVLFWQPASAEIPPVHFRTPPTFAAGNGPWHVVTADVNGDGQPDLITANFNQATVSVLLGNGDDTFAPAVHYAVGTGPDSVAVGDFNGDGHLDLVTANANGWSQPGNVSVLLGRGDGTFGTPTNFAVGQGPRGVVVADFNGDGNSDLATAISGGWFQSNQVQVLFGRGDGTFDSPASFTVGNSPEWIAVGDFNRDGHPDLVTVNTGPQASGNTVSVLLNNGNGTFAAAATYTVGAYPRFVVVSDFNSDHIPDVAVANVTSSSVSVLLGRGDGTFNPASSLPVPSGVSQLAVGDFNGDDKLDLAALGGDYDSGTVSVFLGSGTGAFSAPTGYSIGADLLSICVADFNNDNKTDLAVTAGYDNTVMLMTGAGNGTFSGSMEAYSVGGLIDGILAADFNQDGALDLATVNLESNLVTVLLQNTNNLGLFYFSSNYTVGYHPHTVKAGDFNNDGVLDLVTANFDDSLTILRGRKTLAGGFAYDKPAVHVGSNHNDVAVGDFNGDGKLDLVTPNYYGASLSVVLGNGDCTFRSGAHLSVNTGPTCVVVDDFNGDGKADIAVGYEGGSKISLLLGRGDGTFDPKTDIDTYDIPYFITTGDFNFDGKPDLVAAHPDSLYISVMMNRGDGTFAPPAIHQVGNGPNMVAVGDFNGDNQPDIVAGNYASVSVLLGFGDGTFSTATNHFVGGYYAAVGDFNQDSMPDLAIALGSKLGIFWNDTLPTLQISQVPAGVRVAWPSWKGYRLEATTNLLAGNSWAPVSITPAVIGSQAVITNLLSSGNQAFRLKRQ